MALPHLSGYFRSNSCRSKEEVGSTVCCHLAKLADTPLRSRQTTIKKGIGHDHLERLSTGANKGQDRLWELIDTPTQLFQSLHAIRGT